MTWLEYFRTRFPVTTALLNAHASKQYTFSIGGMVFSKLGVWADREKLCWMWWDAEIEKSYYGFMKNPPGKIQAFCESIDESLEKHAAFVDGFLEKDLGRKTLSELKTILQQNLEYSFPVN